MAIVRKTLILGSATITAQLIAVGFQPYLKKLYSVQDFGEFQLYLAIVSFLTVFFTMKIEYFLYQVRSIKLLNIISFGIVLFALAILLVMIPLISIIFLFFSQNYDFSNYKFLLLIVLGGLFTAIYRFSLLKSSISLNYSEIARGRILRRITEGTAQAIFHKFGVIGLGVGEVCGNIIFSLTSQKFKKNITQKTSKKNSKNVIRYTALFFKRNKSSALRKSITDFIDMWSELVLTISITIYSTFEMLGYFELASRLLIGPMAIVSASLSPIIIGTAKKNVYDKNFRMKEYILIFSILLISALVIFILNHFFTESLIKYFFGDEWLLVALLMDILLLNILFQFIISPFGEILVIYNRLKWDANWKILRALSLSVILLPLDIEIQDRIRYFCLINILLYFFYSCLILQVICKSKKYV